MTRTGAPGLAAPPPAAEPAPQQPSGHSRVSSLLMSSAGHRLAAALGLVLVLWLAVAWALAGTG
jgi:hypothetical protein